MKKALVLSMVAAMFLTSIHAIAQTESADQQLGAPGAAPESDKDIGSTGARDSSANQKLGAPGAARESDKNIGPGPSDSTIGSDNKPTHRSAPSKGKKQRDGSHGGKGQSPAQSVR